MLSDERTVLCRDAWNEIENSLNIKQMAGFYQSAKLIMDGEIYHAVEQAVMQVRVQMK
ncbi:hypothetical protein D3C73_1470830 [compost metagenome]